MNVAADRGSIVRYWPDRVASCVCPQCCEVESSRVYVSRRHECKERERDEKRREKEKESRRYARNGAIMHPGAAEPVARRRCDSRRHHHHHHHHHRHRRTSIHGVQTSEATSASRRNAGRGWEEAPRVFVGQRRRCERLRTVRDIPSARYMARCMRKREREREREKERECVCVCVCESERVGGWGRGEGDRSLEAAGGVFTAARCDLLRFTDIVFRSPFAHFPSLHLFVRSFAFSRHRRCIAVHTVIAHRRA